MTNLGLKGEITIVCMGWSKKIWEKTTIVYQKIVNLQTDRI